MASCVIQNFGATYPTSMESAKIRAVVAGVEVSEPTKERLKTNPAIKESRSRPNSQAIRKEASL